MSVDLESLLALHKAGTPGPWTAERPRPGQVASVVAECCDPDGRRAGVFAPLAPPVPVATDAALIAAAVNALPELVAEMKDAQLALSIADEQVRGFRAGLAGEPEPRGMSDAGIDAWIRANEARVERDDARIALRDQTFGHGAALSAARTSLLAEWDKERAERDALRTERDHLAATCLLLTAERDRLAATWRHMVVHTADPNTPDDWVANEARRVFADDGTAQREWDEQRALAASLSADVARAADAQRALAEENAKLREALTEIRDIGVWNHRKDCAAIDYADEIGLDALNEKDNEQADVLAACDCGFAEVRAALDSNESAVGARGTT